MFSYRDKMDEVDDDKPEDAEECDEGTGTYVMQYLLHRSYF